MTTTEAKPATSPDDLLKAALGGQEASRQDGAPQDTPKAAETPASAATSVPPASEIKVEAKVPNGLAKPGAKAGAPASVFAAAQRLSAGLRGTEPRLAAVAGTALVLGAILGASALSLGGSRDPAPGTAIVSLATAMEANRSNTAKLTATLAKLEQGLADLKTATEAARKDSRGGAVSEKIGQLDKSLTTKIANLGEKIDQAEREQATRVSALARGAAAKAEPTQTGSLAEPRERTAEKSTDAKVSEIKPVEAKVAEPVKVAAKPAEVKASEPAKAVPGKPSVLDGFALRDVFDGAAIVEARNRRLYQVMPGDTLPGAGRVEGIERQGRNWVLVTRAGVVMPQPW